MLVPPATIGILGGGPTARYLEQAAQRMGYKSIVLDPAQPTPCDVVTVVDRCPIPAMRIVAAGHPVHPSADVVELCMDRVAVKQFLRDLDLAVGPYVVIDSEADVASASATKFSAILKSRHHGGGKAAQVRVANHGELLAAWDKLERRSCILEQRLTLGRELSIVAARSLDGTVAAYPVAQQQFVHGRLDFSYAPASLLGNGQADAAELATYLATELKIVGLLTVHMFVVGRDVYVHELIPRPTALGLHTLDGSRTDQYEQQLRAICGLALGDTAMAVPGVALSHLRSDMLSEEKELHWERVLNESGAHLHLYDPVGDDGIIGHLAACSGTAAGSTSVVRRLRKQLTSS